MKYLSHFTLFLCAASFALVVGAKAEEIRLECFNQNLKDMGAYERTEGIVAIPQRLIFETERREVRMERYDLCEVLSWGDPFIMFSCISLAENPLDNRITSAIFDRRTSRLASEAVTKLDLQRMPNFGSSGTVEYKYNYDDCERRHF